jgi:hypothetical protein
MFITFRKSADTNSLVLPTYEIQPNEFYFQNDTFQFFIDSNLPVNTIEQECRKIEGDNITSLLKYLKTDGVIVVFNKALNQIIVQRDEAGLCSIYYYSNNSELIFSSIVHKIGQRFKLPLNKLTIQQWLTFDFLWDGQTFYHEVNQVMVDQTLKFDHTLIRAESKQTEIRFSDRENTNSETENFQTLRKEIVEAHRLYVREKNIIFLSGGIDSVAMLIAMDDLVEKDRIESHSFKEKATDKDETEYAQSISDHLQTKLKIIERDVSGEINHNVFKEKVSSLNNPYLGIWIFANQITEDVQKIYFAGQDTRLHTPALNSVDLIAFQLFTVTARFPFLLKILNLPLIPIQFVFDFLTRNDILKSRIFRGLRRASYIADTKEYLLRFYFKRDYDHIKKLGIPRDFFEAAAKSYQLDLKDIFNQRALYNYVVSVKWREQYVNDIRYMIDMVKQEGGRLAMPFYNRRLAFFSSSTPFNLSTRFIEGKGAFGDKKVAVNKFVLRQSLRDKIDDKTYYRGKGAPNTFHIVFNQGLSQILRDILRRDLKREDSLIQRLGLQSFVAPFLERKNPFEEEEGGYSYLIKIYHLSCLIIYAFEVDYKMV